MDYPKTEIPTGVSQWGLSATDDFKFPYIADWNFVVSTGTIEFEQKQMTDLVFLSLGIGWKDSPMSRRCTVMTKEVIFRLSPVRTNGLLTLLTFSTNTLEVNEIQSLTWQQKSTPHRVIGTVPLASSLTRHYIASSRHV